MGKEGGIQSCGGGDWRWGKREGYRAAVGVIGGGERGRDTELRWG